MSPVPALDGTGVLVQTNAGGEARNTFTFYGKDGKVSSLNVGFNAHFSTWLPGSTKAVFNTSIGYDYRFHLIDWATGKRLWEVPDPNPARVPGVIPSGDAGKDYLLIGGREYVRREPVLSLYALHPKTGQVVARWLPDPIRASAEDGLFLRLRDRLYFLTAKEFAEVNAVDIGAKRKGWR